MGWLPGREGARLRRGAMQLLRNVSRAVACSFFASAVALQPRMRAWTLFDTGVAGTACRGGVAVTGWATVPESAWAICIASRIAAVTGSRRGFMSQTIANLRMRAACSRIKNA